MTDFTEKYTTIDTSATTTKDTAIDKNATIATTTNVTSDIDERKSPYRIPKKAKTTTPENVSIIYDMFLIPKWN
jgi:UDP-3-O-[3-hydroxymyristoyl] glucosamine N-acyltransferase